MAIHRFEDTDALPAAKQHARELTIVAQDPRIRHPDGRIVRARVSVPADWLEPGPRGQRFHVLDYDATTRRRGSPVDLTDPREKQARVRPWSCLDRFADRPDADLETSAAFHAQNVYAVAARTLAAFERALGRRVGWAFPRHQLYLFPHAFAGPNACYVARDGAVFFGYLDDADGERVYACLSHDIIVHEVTHAILDGLRPRLIEPSLPDQLAFHEAFADIVALLSVFSIPELVEAVLGTPDTQGRIPAENVEQDVLAESALFTVADQFGEAVSRSRGSALRRSLTLEPGEDWKDDPDFESRHRRAEVVVAAILRTLLDMWTRRLRTLTSHGRVDHRRAAEAGARSAEHLLRMSIRAIDYVPSVDLEFADFLDALLVADEIVAPDDTRGYRDSIEGAFRAFGVTPSEPRVVDLAREPPTYSQLNFAALRSDPEEVFRFIWQNADALRIPRDYSLLVNAVRPSVRVGPDGLVVTEIVVDYVQTLRMSHAQAARDLPELVLPDGLDPAGEIRFWGGGTLTFDQFGTVKLHVRKPLEDWDRQSRRLDHLWRAGHFARRKRSRAARA